MKTSKKCFNLMKITDLAGFLGKSETWVYKMLKSEFHREEVQILLNYYLPIFIRLQLELFEKDILTLEKKINYEKFRQRTRKIREENKTLYDKIKRNR